MHKQMLIVAVVLSVVGVITITKAAAAPSQQTPVTEVCLGCICQAISGCNSTAICNGDVCGLFRMTWAYWSDAGKPAKDGEDPTSPSAYANCANDPFCAARAVQGYMGRFGQDCNNDNQINCFDHAAIHKFGGYGCQGEQSGPYWNVLNQCLQQVQQIDVRID